MMLGIRMRRICYESSIPSALIAGFLVWSMLLLSDSIVFDWSVAACDRLAATATPERNNTEPKRTGHLSSDDHYSVIVYRATPAGIAAAIAAMETSSTDDESSPMFRERRRRRVLLLEPTAHIGGMATEGGIGLRDAFTNDFRFADHRSSQYQWGRLNAKHYGLDGWVWQRDNYIGEQSFWLLLERASVEVRLNANFREGAEGLTLVQAQRGGEPSKGPYRIQSLHLEDGSTVSADYFIDASYEGELMQATGVVDWTSGRESKHTYQEPFAGVGNFSAAQFPGPVNPYLPDGSMLRYVKLGRDLNPLVGEADYHNLMAYSYRVCLTKDPLLAVPVTPPTNYSADDFELARRLIRLEVDLQRRDNKAPSLSQPWLYMDYTGYGSARNNSFVKFDACCGASAMGIDAVGLALGFTRMSRKERQAVADQHRYYVQGLLWFWRSDDVVPSAVREEHAAYGLCGDEWTDNGHFPRQLYVREASRLVGDKVFTQWDRSPSCRSDSIAVGAWGLDQHDMQRIAFYDQKSNEWLIKNEGLRGDAKEQGGVFPFEIPYWIILPKKRQMSNFAVVSCPSTSHVAFAAIRVEPTLWLIGQAAGAASMLASSLGLESLHDVELDLLQKTLKGQGSKIHIHSSNKCTA